MTDRPLTPLYQRILGNNWDNLAPRIRELHSVTSESVFVGRCRVERGRNPLSRLIAAMIGLPVAGEDQEVIVTLAVEHDGERWTRRIGGQSFSSLQRPAPGVVREQFGAVTVYMALIVEGSYLRYEIRRWTLLGIPLPMWLGPPGRASESVEGGKFCFEVEMYHPLTGLIVRYRGLLSRR